MWDIEIYTNLDYFQKIYTTAYHDITHLVTTPASLFAQPSPLPFNPTHHHRGQQLGPIPNVPKFVTYSNMQVDLWTNTAEGSYIEIVRRGGKCTIVYVRKARMMPK
jgi:hypothetical protein